MKRIYIFATIISIMLIQTACSLENRSKIEAFQRPAEELIDEYAEYLLSLDEEPVSAYDFSEFEGQTRCWLYYVINNELSCTSFDISSRDSIVSLGPMFARDTAYMISHWGSVDAGKTYLSNLLIPMVDVYDKYSPFVINYRRETDSLTRNHLMIVRWNDEINDNGKLIYYSPGNKPFDSTHYYRYGDFLCEKPKNKFRNLLRNIYLLISRAE